MMPFLVQLYHTHKSNPLVQGAVAVLVLGGLLAVLFAEKDVLPWSRSSDGEGMIVEDRIVVPHIQEVSPMDARKNNHSGYDVPLSPVNDGERVSLSQKTVSLKDSLTLSFPAARKWSDDALLSFVKSLGTVTLSGQSTGWEVVFSSEIKKTGYAVIVSLGKVVFTKEISLSTRGASLPRTGKDLKEILSGYSTHPLYKGAMLSGVVFYFNTDNDKWYYNISTSKGVSSVSVE